MLASGRSLFAFPLAPYEIEPLAKIGQVFFRNRFRAPIPALLGNTRIVADAIKAHFQIRPAPMAGLAAPDEPLERVFPAAIMAMSR